MNIDKIGSFNFSTGINLRRIDKEEEEILRRLAHYGVKGTMNKSVDRAKLHELEVAEVKKEKSVSSKYLTVSRTEQEKIISKTEEKKEEANQFVNPEAATGAKALGEQIYLAIQMKKKIPPM